jgi:exodeoxyribonuclease V alpha subunit
LPTTLTGEVERVTYENEENSFRVIKVGSLEGPGARPGTVAVVGFFQAVGPGTRVRLTGQFVVDARHGEQFRVDALVPIEPSTLSGLEKYLGSGLIAGIGPGFARRIVKKFGMATLEVLDREPDRLREVSGLGAGRVQEIKKTWDKQRSISNVMMLLQTHGASPSLAARIYERYGDRAATVVQRSPYRLALEVRGVGFKTADRLARSLGIAGDHPERAQAGVLHELGALADLGHTFFPRTQLVERTAEMLGIDAVHVESAVDALWASNRVVIEDDAVSLTRLHRAEQQVAESLAQLVESPAARLERVDALLERFEAKSGIHLAEQQLLAVRVAAERKVVVITGGPGVGKTTIVRAILSVLDHERLRIRLAAPTGRAAKRLSEAAGREATTIHRLLEFEPRTLRFQRHGDNPLAADAVIVDEASMIDVQLAAALLDAIPPAARLVIVGDADQLPSVGPGAFLRDVIDSRAMATVRLEHIFRQASHSRIVESAHHILRGEPPESAASDDPAADFFVIHRRDAEQAAALVCELVVERIPRRFAFDPRSEVQVLTPMHRGPAGTVALNAALQKSLNPTGPALEVRGQMLRVGDKVMQTRNDYEKEVFNGDLGVVASIDEADRRLIARFDDRTVTYEDADVEALMLAYATSIHKSQGSEYPAVVIPLLTTHFVMLSRNLLYTAVTRAKRLCVLVTDPRALKLALAEIRREERMTGLRDRIRAAVQRPPFDK